MSFVSQSTKKKYSIAMDGPVGAVKYLSKNVCKGTGLYLY